MQRRRPLISGGVLAAALVAAPLTTPGATLACGAALGIVVVYGALVRVARASRTIGLTQIGRASIAIGIIAGGAMAALVRVWSDAVGLSIVAGIVAWLLILASGAGYAALTSRLQRTRAAARTCSATVAA